MVSPLGLSAILRTAGNKARSPSARDWDPGDLYAHGVQEHAPHLPSFLVAGLGRQETGEAAAEAVGGHVFRIAQVPELAVPKPVDGQEMRAVFSALGLSDENAGVACPVDQEHPVVAMSAVGVTERWRLAVDGGSATS